METNFEQLFRDTGAAHHQAYIETDGADPDWPIWYAQYLHPRIEDLIGELTVSELVYYLVTWDRALRDGASNDPWPTYYAEQLRTLVS